jgi:hypothetical protein
MNDDPVLYLFVKSKQVSHELIGVCRELLWGGHHEIYQLLLNVVPAGVHIIILLCMTSSTTIILQRNTLCA